MSFVSCYTRIQWINKSDGLTTPLGAYNLNKMDKALETIDNEVVYISAKVGSIDRGKADIEQLNNMVVDFSYNDKTGVMTFTRYDGTTFTVDTAIEKMAVNFFYDSEKEQLVITLEDGTKQYVDMSALLTQYEFDNTDTIALTVGENGHISASIRNGSITRDMLSSDVLSSVISSEANAQNSASAAAQSATNADIDAKMSQSYAVGGSGIRYGEDVDNSRYYHLLAKSYKDDTKKLCEDQQTALTEINKKLSLAEFSIDDNGNLTYTDNTAYSFSVNDNGDLEWEVA